MRNPGRQHPPRRPDRAGRRARRAAPPAWFDAIEAHAGAHGSVPAGAPADEHGGPPGRFRPGGRPEGWGRRPRQAPWLGAVIAALCFHVFGNWTQATALSRPADVVACALLLIGPLALAWRGRAPIVVLAVCGAATIGFAALSTPAWSYAVAPVIALFSAVKAGRRRAAVAVAAAGYLTYLTVTWFGGAFGLPAAARPDLRDTVLIGLGLALTVFLGSAARARAIYLAEMTKARAERARAREEQERRQASDERLRIARELHDVLGHHLSLINVQAGVGLHLMDNRPEQAREALAAIKTASSEALREVRAVLGVLRPEEEAAPRQPAPGLGRLTDLTADAGLPVTTTTVGERRELPAEVDRAAYRIVQEALTNVRRHAEAGAAATVSVTYAENEIRLSIRNDGPAAKEPPDGAGGSGIAGMRARAASLGGTLAAGPPPAGGYLVSAVLPTATGENA
ncbi:sensor histidine kinase [Actinoplanes sp. NPDC049118]|uniref:sensor histidine kinase n=1 Tax=Actinoplanes sp. NPDC049118 TaxID=3155769 RepID=UPI0033DF41EC